jgi:argininosuccinate lyase
MMATDLADYLVDRGVPFREAHQAVGYLVRKCEETGLELGALPQAVYAEAHAGFGEDAREALSPERSLTRREVEGGTGPQAVTAQLERARGMVSR